MAQNGGFPSRAARSMVNEGMGVPTSIMQSTQSIETQNTIDHFFKRDSNGIVRKTQKLIDWEKDRVDKVRKVRDNAV